MRKVVESTLVSADGVIGDPHVWANDYFDGEARAYALDRLLASDGMLMGRRTYEVFASVWPRQTGEYADRVNSIREYVFSSTLEHADWTNSSIVRGDVAVEVAKLKQQDGRDLVMYGHGPLGQTMLEHHLLDGLQFWVHPVFVGRGTRLSRDGQEATLRLVASKTLATGVVVVSYEPAT
jgi:dihydrofolate reductase